MSLTAKEFFSQAESRFQVEKAGDVKVSYSFDISGDNGGKWSIKIENGTVHKADEPLEGADVTFAAKDTDWAEICLGKLNEQMAFMTGKSKVKGNMAQAMKLKTYFRMGA